MEAFSKLAQWLLGPEPIDHAHPGHLLPRWIFLRTLGLIYFSAFYSLIFQIKGLIGPDGILPARDYLPLVARAYPNWQRFWVAPTLFWASTGNHFLMFVCWLGIIASILVILNVWPKATLPVCFLCFLSFVAAARDFSSYQSDGMLLEAGFISFFFAPPGIRPGFGKEHPPSRASLFLLRWEWFRIYFQSGVVKLASGDYSWRHLTAMDDYYQNGPLPTWIGWYVQHLPHRFHAGTVIMTFVAELGLVFMLFMSRRLKLICFFIVTPFQIGIILTANYTFLNYLVLCLGFLLLDDGFLRPLLPYGWKHFLPDPSEPEPQLAAAADAPASAGAGAGHFQRRLSLVKRILEAWCLGLVFYVTTVEMLGILPMGNPFPDAPVRALEPFRIANQYGLFAVMTHERYEIEFQGSGDGKTWTAYPFRYKPQDIFKAPGIYAPYQPRFDWNLWFASLGPWRQNVFVVETEERLLRNDPDVLSLFAGNPFAASPPTRVRTVLWQYWFTTMAEKRKTGAWWDRKLLGPYSPALEKTPEGQVVIIDAGPAVEPEK